MYKNTSLFSWLNRHYRVLKTDRAVFIDTPVNSGKIVLSVIERH